MSVTLTKAMPKTLRELGLNEQWLQEQIKDDPSMIGLGDLALIERERSQPTGGRLDFLLSDPEEEVRYEVEIMLGRLDESHIIRTIEYWDIERTRFPKLEHRAVIIAEEITNRFFNVISLLNRAIPIIAIQMNVLQVEDKFVLSFTKVLDITEMYAEEEPAPGVQVDRAYWENNSNPNTMTIVDKIVSLIPRDKGPARVTYNKHHIAIGLSGSNFGWLHPRKSASHCHTILSIDPDDNSDWIKRLSDAGIDARLRGNDIRLRISLKDIAENEPLIKDLVAKAEEYSRP